MKFFFEISGYIFCLTLLRYVKANHPPLALSVLDDGYKLVDYDYLMENVNEMEEDDPKDFEGLILSCPAERKEGAGVIFIHLVEKIIKKKSDRVKEFRCKNKYQPSLEESSTPPDDFVTNPTNALEVYESGYKICNHDNRLEEAGFPVFNDNSDECRFFPTLKILFNKNTGSVQQVRYEVIGTFDGESEEIDSPEICENLDLGSNLIGVKMEDVYGRDNQNEVLKDMGTMRLIQTETININIEQSESGETMKLHFACERVRTPISQHMWKDDVDREYFIEQSLAPPEQFRGSSLQLTVCSHLVTAPMWPNTVYALSRVQAFVQKLANEVGKIKIIVGTVGVFKYSAIENNECGAKSLRFLSGSRTKKVQVPEIVYTLVIHSLYDKSQKIRRDFGIILITPNKRSTNSIAAYCEEIDCKVAGFDKVNQPDQDLQTRCCKFSQYSLDKLKIKYLDVELSRRNALNLNAFFRTMETYKIPKGENIADKINMSDESDEMGDESEGMGDEDEETEGTI